MNKFGFMVVDCNGALFGTLRGPTIVVLHKFKYGPHSFLTFTNSRSEKQRHDNVMKITELASKFYIDRSTGLVNVSGLVLAVSPDFRAELTRPDILDRRLRGKGFLTVLDVFASGGENGNFHPDIDLLSEILASARLDRERRVIGSYFEEFVQFTGKYVYGLDRTVEALEMGAVETLIVWEDLDIDRYVLRSSSTGEIVVKYLTIEQEFDQGNFRDSENITDLKVEKKMSLVEWFANEHKRFGCSLEFVTEKSEEGFQFCKGLGGIGATLRYPLDGSSSDEPFDEKFTTIPVFMMEKCTAILIRCQGLFSKCGCRCY